MITTKKALLMGGLFAIAGTANAGYEIKTGENSKLIFGGYIKVDTRYTDGNIEANDYWYGGGNVLAEDQSNFGISANETRINTKYIHGDVTGFIEMDFYGDAIAGGGNEIISNSSNPRIRHAFIQYKNILVGQTWTTFQNTSALAEAADFGGPLVASAFIRQGQIRYTMGGLQVSIENPESFGGNRIATSDTAGDGVPDFIAKYTFSGDWGNVSVSGLGRKLESTLGNTHSAFGYGVAGRINTYGKDDFRFQVYGGNVGRYIGVVASTDIVGEEVEDTTSVMVAYRHFWTEDMRSSVFYGNTTTDETDRDRTHWGVNLFKNYTKELSFGVEVGNFEMAEFDADSNYFQVSAKYTL
ncbi:hypothetical protein WNY51_10240 [Pseudocolwellia sp. AS88]|uniref:hypothetical protein n=1 Tax=Pseudocolwellia TaxID=2848177 RepID=UPI0026EDFB42|nr:hypothetical protein [Pseudocolwellia sp. AS88]MDO7084255.1 hypothetical protein [Pseudocolwellia sp. AS88]